MNGRTREPGTAGLVRPARAALWLGVAAVAVALAGLVRIAGLDDCDLTFLPLAACVPGLAAAGLAGLVMHRLGRVRVGQAGVPALRRLWATAMWAVALGVTGMGLGIALMPVQFLVNACPVG